MRRRAFLKVSIPLIAGVGCAGENQPSNPVKDTVTAVTPGARGQTLADGIQRIHLRVIGLNAVFESPAKVEIATLNAEGVELPGSAERFPPHYAHLVIAKTALDNQSGGQAPTADEMKRWNLRSKTQEFRMWNLKGSAATMVSVEGLTGPPFESRIFGAMPMRRLWPDGKIANWQTKKVVAARVELNVGTITDDLPRRYKKKTENRFWKFTAKKWEESPDVLPVKLTDTVKAELEASSLAPAKFVIVKDSVRTEILTKGDDVEVYFICLPAKILQHEEEHPIDLHHTLAGYELFDNPPPTKPIPRGDPGVDFTEEPVFCPPLFFS